MVYLVIIAIVLAIASVLFSLHCSIVFNKYTGTLKDWSQACVDEANRTLQSNARLIEAHVIEKLTLNLNSDENDLQKNESLGEVVESE